MMLPRCILTVPSETSRALAISAFDIPNARLRRTSDSRSLRVGSLLTALDGATGPAERTCSTNRAATRGESGLTPSKACFNALRISSALDSLRMYPDAPALNIGSTASLVSSVVTARTQISGHRVLICSVASIPFIFGILTSIMTALGCKRSIASNASCPFSACPTTVTSGSRDTKCESATRTKGSSSVISTRISVMSPV